MTMTRHTINPEMAEQDHMKNWNISPPAGSINMVFGDGHAQLVKMNYGIWQFNWHRAWGQYLGISPGNPQ
jgi:prepilin-type processing-associated H-X9-DG protein